MVYIYVNIYMYIYSPREMVQFENNFTFLRICPYVCCTPLIYSTTYSLFSNTSMTHVFPLQTVVLDILYGSFLLQEEIYKRLHIWGRNYLFHALFSCWWYLRLHSPQFGWKFTILPCPLVSSSSFWLGTFHTFDHLSYLRHLGLWGLVASHASPCPPHS